jgi:hypothetical protein
MKRMTPKALRRLENIQDNIQIAIYLPIIPGPENTAKNIGALHHATALLKKTMSANEIAPENQRVISKHITELERELTLPVSGKSLAIFITDFNQLLVYQVSFEVETAIYFMAPNVQLEPLKRYYRERSSYWVLVLSQKGCTLMRGKGHRLSPVQAADLSIDLKSALGLDETEPDIQAHAVGSSGGRVREGFHGHGGFKDIRKKYIENYLRLIDKRLQKYLGMTKEPIYLVGLSGTQHLFSKVSRRKNVILTRVSPDMHHQNILLLRDKLLHHIQTQAV